MQLMNVAMLIYALTFRDSLSINVSMDAFRTIKRGRSTLRPYFRN